MSDEYSWTEKGTLYSKVYDDIFFRDGEGLSESQFVFIEGNNLTNRLVEKDLKIGELGFGTGLNFLLTWRHWQKFGQPQKKRLTFISCEKHLLSPAIFQQAHHFFPELNDLSQQLRNKLPLLSTGFHFLEFAEGQVSLLLLLGDACESLKQFEGKIDAWFLDGFAPAKNSEMWSEQLFKQLAYHSDKGTTFATFTAAGFVRRGLESVGFKVERVKGFGFKRHMTIGQYEGYVKDRVHLAPWFYSSYSSLKNKKDVAVIGAGIAGASMAYKLSQLGYEVTLFEAEEKVAAKASGNRRGMVYPLISKKVDNLGRVSEIAAHSCLNLVKELQIEYRQGVYEFLTEEKKNHRFNEAISRYHSDYLELVNVPEISKSYPAIFHKTALSFCPKDLVEKLIAVSGIQVFTGYKLTDLQQDAEGVWGLWFSGREKPLHFSQVFICNSFESKMLEKIKDFPLRLSRGQVVYLSKEDVGKNIEDMNYIHYLSRVENGYLLGATFDVDDADENFRESDSESLVASFRQYFPDLLRQNLSVKELKGRVCFRAVTHDYFPVVGGVPDSEFYLENYQSLKLGRPISSYPNAKNLMGLHLSTGHGSRGLAFAPLSAAYLTKFLVDGLFILPTSLIQAVHSARFLVKKLKNG